MAANTDWLAWHEAYGDPESTLPCRLQVVQGYVDAWLDQAPRPARALSLCAGEARELIPVLARRDDVADVSAVLVELHADLVARAESAAREAGLDDRIEVRRSDAGDLSSYADAAPADLVLLAGIFGNISDGDIRRTVTAARMLCAPGGWVIWTRHRHDPDLTGVIREWFADAAFDEIGFTGTDGFGVGAQRYVGPPQPWTPPVSLFTFIR